jgi:hypothetical protein
MTTTRRMLLAAAFAFSLAPFAAATGAIQQPEPSQMAKPAAETPPQPSPSKGSDPSNVRLELTISVIDAKGAAVVPPKTASLFVVDGDNGRIRTGRSASSAPEPVNMAMPLTPVLNVDATPRVLPNGRIRVTVSFEYRPGSAQNTGEPIHINQRVSAILENGKPLIVSQTSDPTSDRLMKVELKATISK